jgi:hypothetical protein
MFFFVVLRAFFVVLRVIKKIHGKITQYNNILYLNI